jgi:hypothetical protein
MGTSAQRLSAGIAMHSKSRVRNTCTYTIVCTSVIPYVLCITFWATIKILTLSLSPLDGCLTLAPGVLGCAAA